MAVSDISGVPRSTESSASRVILAMIFIGALLIPVRFYAGALMLNPPRVVLLVLFVPMLASWLSGRYGRFLATDWLVLAFVSWFALAFLVTTGVDAIDFVGIAAVETFGSYLIGRSFIRSASDFRKMVQFLFVALIILIPAAVLESVYKMRIYNDLFSFLGQTFPWVDYAPRMGLYRAQVVFEHPILYGVFVSMTFSLLFLLPRGDGKVHGPWRAWAAGAASFFSLSSGAYLSIMTQIGLLLWDRIMRANPNRWKLLIILTVIAYVVVDLLSNRTPFQVFASYMTFNAGTAYWRILIFEYGIQNVWDNPVFGLGFGNWNRPGWMKSASVDNYWLLTAMRTGIPAFLLIATTFAALILQLSREKIVDPERRTIRKAIIINFVGLAVALATVHVWGPTYMFMMFLMGASGWLLTTPEPTQALEPGMQGSAAPMPQDSSRYTRFATQPKTTPRTAPQKTTRYTRSRDE